MWATVVVKDMFSGSPYYDFSLKPLFNALMYVNYKIAAIFEIHPMFVARTLFALNTGLVCLIAMGILRRMNVSRSAAWLALFLLVTTSTFIKRFGQVRSDIAALTVILLLIWWALSPDWTQRKLRQKLTGFFVALAVCGALTAKSLPLVMAWGALFMAEDWRKMFRERRAMLLVSALAFGALGAALLQPSWRIFLDSFPAQYMGSEYFARVRFMHVQRFFFENPVALVVLAANFIFATRPPEWIGPGARKLAAFACFAWIYLLVFPDRLPFFIAALAPLFFIAFAPALESKRATGFLKSLVVAFGVFSLLYWSSVLFLRHNHREQAEYSRWARERFAKNPALSIYDPVGVLPFTDAYNWFLGPAQRSNDIILQLIQFKKVDVLFYVSKLEILEPALSVFLRLNYVHDGTGLFLRKVDVPRDAFENQSLGMPRLKGIVEREMAPFVAHPDQPFVLEIRLGALDLTRYAKLVAKDGSEAPFEGRLTYGDLESFKELRLPPTANTVTLMPVTAATPFSSKWTDLFRFDPEI